MKIAIFINPAILEKAGVGRFAYNLVKEILKQDKSNSYLLLANFFKSYKTRKNELEEFVKNSGNKNTEIYISRIPDPWRDFIFGTNLPIRDLYHQKFDLYFALFPAQIPQNGYNKQISVIYDFVYDKFPESQGNKYSHYYRTRTKNALRSSKKLICISEATQADLIKTFDIAKDKTEVVTPAIDETVFFPRKPLQYHRVAKKYGITKPYILTVGTLEPRKNLERLIDAYLMLPFTLQNKYQLVFVGNIGWHSNSLIKKLKNIPGAMNKFVQTGFVSDNDLASLYSGASLFVYPSLYEGFGIPPLEAMACKTPVVASNTSSIPEVVGSAGVLINPTNTEEIKEAMKKVLIDKHLQQKLVELGFAQIKKFSWEKSAKKMIKIFKSVEKS